jgi:hypothetical protein
MDRRFWPLLLSALVLVTCQRTGGEPPSEMRGVPVDEGLSMQLPPGHEVAGSGLSMRVFAPAPDRTTRSPPNIILTELAAAKTRQVAGRDIRYAVPPSLVGRAGRACG